MPDTSRLIVTPGEPAGIGPDLVLTLLQHIQDQASIPFCVIADKTLLRQRAAELGMQIQIHEILPHEELNTDAATLNVIHEPVATEVKTGQLDPRNAAYVLRCLDKAMQLCIENNNQALVTGPVHKGVINDAGIKFSGHTEYLAERAGITRPVMMLATTGLRVALATTHLPLHEVSAQITRPLLEEVLCILHQDLMAKFHIAQPRITVCGLNPHAGESGHLGMEEILIIEPVINKLKLKGMALTGPVPADTAFTPKQMQQTDAYLAMYHDQGLPVLKHVGFGNAVNITLGLPFVRTSVDHGTALELAGTGKADLTSLQVALQTAYNMLHKVPGHV